MPSQLKPLHGESFTQFLRDSAANSGKWPQWVRGEERLNNPAHRGSGQDCAVKEHNENREPSRDSGE
jgi:hypothetical protein